MTARLASISLASLLLCTACPSDDGGETSSGETDSGTETATETAADTGTESATDGGSETEVASCGVAAGVCCMELEECETTEDCCMPEQFTCALEAASTKCIDLAAMCTTCLNNCLNGGVPPDVCQMSCAVWCNPP